MLHYVVYDYHLPPWQLLYAFLKSVLYVATTCSNMPLRGVFERI